MTTTPARRVARVIASGFGSGYAPFAPGTWGSLLGLAIGAGILASEPALLAIAILVAALGGLWAIRASGAEREDPGWVVIDEIAGQMIALLPLARPSPAGLAAAFALFRLLDIAKPGPIGWIDRRHDAIGVMGDDLAAGAIAAVILWVAIRTLPWFAS